MFILKNVKKYFIYNFNLWPFSKVLRHTEACETRMCSTAKKLSVFKRNKKAQD